MWLKERMDELGLTYEELGQLINRNKSTVRNWNSNDIHWGLREKSEWQLLADALQWTLLDILIAYGYPIYAEHPDLSDDELVFFLNLRSIKSDKKRATALRFASAAAELFQNDHTITDEDLE